MSSTGSCRVMLRPPTSFWAFGTHAGSRGTRSKKRVKSSTRTPADAGSNRRRSSRSEQRSRRCGTRPIGFGSIPTPSCATRCAIRRTRGRRSSRAVPDTRSGNTATAIRRSPSRKSSASATESLRSRRSAGCRSAAAAVIRIRPAGQGGNPPHRTPVGGGRVLRSSGAATE